MANHFILWSAEEASLIVFRLLSWFTVNEELTNLRVVFLTQVLKQIHSNICDLLLSYRVLQLTFIFLMMHIVIQNLKTFLLLRFSYLSECIYFILIVPFSEKFSFWKFLLQFHWLLSRYWVWIYFEMSGDCMKRSEGAAGTSWCIVHDSWAEVDKKYFIAISCC